jgi:hypothetical protein
MLFIPFAVCQMVYSVGLMMLLVDQINTKSLNIISKYELIMSMPSDIEESILHALESLRHDILKPTPKYQWRHNDFLLFWPSYCRCNNFFGTLEAWNINKLVFLKS